MKCRGDAKKAAFVEQWYITPIVRLGLLEGQAKRCCCGNSVRKQYYAFEAQRRDNQNLLKTFIAGDYCARKFLELGQLDPLPLFNPIRALQNQPGDKGSAISDGATTASLEKQRMDPLNKELFDAIHLLCLCWNEPPRPGAGLARTLGFLARRPEKRTQNWAVVRFNQIIGYDSRNRSLGQMLAELRQDNPELKHFPFNLLQDVLEEEGEESNL